MTSGMLFIMLVFILIIIIIILAFHDSIKDKNIKIARLNSLLDSYKKDLEKKESNASSIKWNFRPSPQYSLQLQCDILEKENQQLKQKLQEAVAVQHSISDKVEVPDVDFLLHELGEKNKKTSQLAADILSLQQDLDYLRSLYPSIDELLHSRHNDSTSVPYRNHSRDYLTQEEWDSLTDTQRDQLALDRYVKSHNKTKWQIGRDYELFIAHRYRQQGYDVDPCGSYLKLEDMGRDLILKKDGQIRIVQCKYWSNSKIINERFIFLLYGAVVSYCIEHGCPQSIVKGIFVTNISLSDMAKKCATALGILVMEQYQMGDFPRIKCNVKKDSDGEYVYIYHLPMDPQYDRVKIKDERECYAYTVQEAESYGFRRAN